MFGIDPHAITEEIKKRMDTSKPDEWQNGYIEGAITTLTVLQEQLQSKLGGHLK